MPTVNQSPTSQNPKCRKTGVGGMRIEVEGDLMRDSTTLLL